MSRVLGYSLLLALIATLALPMMSPTQQFPNDAQNRPKWEYKVSTLDGSACSSDGAVSTSLNSLGQQGWELVGYERNATPFPRDAEGTLVIAPAATGPSKDVNPPTADSFQGRISMKMAQTAPGGCRMLFKREWHPPQAQR